MSASRTLLRKLRQPSRDSRILKGRPNGRLIFSQVIICGLARYEEALHATKGWRVVRLSAA